MNNAGWRPGRHPVLALFMQCGTSISQLARKFGLSRSTLLYYDRIGLRLAGMDERAMTRWHAEFERRTPDEHEQFLASLGIPPDEIAGIRSWSRSRSLRVPDPAEKNLIPRQAAKPPRE